MKILKTASGNKLSITRDEWVNIGIRGGWHKSAQRYRGPGRGTSEKEVELYRRIDGTATADDNEGEPFTATIIYEYSPEEKSQRDSGGGWLYPGAPPSVEIQSIKDEAGNEVEVDDLDDLHERFNLMEHYEEMSEGAYDSAMEAKYDSMKEDGLI